MLGNMKFSIFPLDSCWRIILQKRTRLSFSNQYSWDRLDAKFVQKHMLHHAIWYDRSNVLDKSLELKKRFL